MNSRFLSCIRSGLIALGVLAGLSRRPRRCRSPAPTARRWRPLSRDAETCQGPLLAGATTAGVELWPQPPSIQTIGTTTGAIGAITARYVRRHVYPGFYLGLGVPILRVLCPAAQILSRRRQLGACRLVLRPLSVLPGLGQHLSAL